MKSLFKLSLLYLQIGLFTVFVVAQDDETRQASGLPILVGETANKARVPLSGKLTIQGLDPSQPKPVIYVMVYFSGVLIDKRLVNDAGHYYVPGVPREGAILSVEIEGIEVGRYQLPSSAISSIRQDLTINWQQFRSAKGKNEVISINSYYQRTKENEKLFEKALLSGKDKKTADSIKLFKQLLEQDPKDFIAWTELGTLFFSSEKFSEAEEAYHKSLEQKPDFVVALLNLGKLYLAQKQAEKAIPVLMKAVESEPHSAETQHYLGEAYLQTRKGSKAVAHLNEAIRLSPNKKAEIHLRLAALYNGANLKDRAAAEYRLFLEKVPKHAERAKIEKYIKENSPQ